MGESPGPTKTDGALGWRAWLGQALLYGLFAVVIGVFSHWPRYRHLPPDTAVIKLSVVHTGKPISECHQLTADELAALPPNMRAPVSCPRERSPVVVELDIDGAPAARIKAPPSGLSRDGASAIYARIPVASGDREITVRLNDDARSSEFAYRAEQRVTLAPAQVLVIDFDADDGEITLQ